MENLGAVAADDAARRCSSAGSDEKGEPVTAQTVEDLKEPKALSEMLTELGKAVPEVKGPLVDERDQYLASGSSRPARGKQKVVAVVGAAHVPGMTENLGKPIDRAALDRIPPPSLWWRIAKWAVPLAFLALLAFLATRMSAATFAKTMLAWIVPTAVGAGLATLDHGRLDPLGALRASSSRRSPGSTRSCEPPWWSGSSRRGGESQASRIASGCRTTSRRCAGSGATR